MAIITHENQLQLYCEDLASQVIDEIVQGNTSDPHDLIHEFCDASEHVMYYYNAHYICLHCNVIDGHAFIHSIGAPEEGWNYNSMAAAIVYGELVARVSRIYEANKDKRYLKLVG